LGGWEEHKAFYHGHTYTGNPLACAVAIESLEKLERMERSGRLAEGAAWLGRSLEEAFAEHPNVRGLRQLGFAAAVDLGPGDPGSAWAPGERGGLCVCDEARRRGLVLRPLGDSVLIVPPLVIEHSEIDFLTTTLRAAIEAVAPSIPASKSSS
jgi:adenosylmethionine-8-amino-7-oxononanoate aminotransferase